MQSDILDFKLANNTIHVYTTLSWNGPCFVCAALVCCIALNNVSISPWMKSDIVEGFFDWQGQIWRHYWGMCRLLVVNAFWICLFTPHKLLYRDDNARFDCDRWVASKHWASRAAAHDPPPNHPRAGHTWKHVLIACPLLEWKSLPVNILAGDPIQQEFKRRVTTHYRNLEPAN